jgi:exodeoxyribonuclease VII large subunit
MEDFIKKEKTFTILELNNAIQEVIKTGFPQYIWVCGEIQDLRTSFKNNRKNIYLSLIQKHPQADETLAQIPAALFQNTIPTIEKALGPAKLTEFLRNDLEVRFLCKVNFFPKYGKCNLIIQNIDPVYTLGKLAQSKQRLIKKLTEKGILEKNRKTTHIPLVPLRIGLITAHNSAALADFLNELEQSSFGFKVYLADCHMQGTKTEKDILQALDFFNSSEAEPLDLIAVTRGGGSQADLGWFDSEQLAIKVSESKYPVLSAIGHQINLSIMEMASHSYFKTPTELGRYLTEKNNNFLDTLSELQTDLTQTIKPFLEKNKQDLQITASRILNYLHIYFTEHKDTLTRQTTLMQSLTQKNLQNHTDYLERYLNDISRNITLTLKRQKQILKAEKEKIKILDPKNVLKRGFSITLKNGIPLKQKQGIQTGELINTVLYQGTIESKII